MSGPEIVSPCPAPDDREAVELMLVRDDERPVEDVTVVLQSSLGCQTDVTDARGRCRFEGIPKGETAKVTLVGLDAQAWELLSTHRLASRSADSRSAGRWTTLPPKPRPASSHEVRPGECIVRIAYAHGFLPETLWTHNASRWKPHHSKGSIPAGQAIELPTREVGWVDVPSGHLAVLHRIGIPAQIVLTLRSPDGTAWALSPYVVQLQSPSGRAIPNHVGFTDDRGRIRLRLLPDVTRGRLHVQPTGSSRRFTYELAIGGLPPADEPAGARARLWALGYRGAPDDPLRRQDQELFRFRDEQSLTGDELLDDATVRALTKRFGC